MRYFIESDEFYPVYTIADRETRLTDHVELTPEERADFERVWKEWQDWQDRIGDLI
jgi:hypothetical protein